MQILDPPSTFATQPDWGLPPGSSVGPPGVGPPGPAGPENPGPPGPSCGWSNRTVGVSSLIVAPIV